MPPPAFAFYVASAGTASRPTNVVSLTWTFCIVLSRRNGSGRPSKLAASPMDLPSYLDRPFAGADGKYDLDVVAALPLKSQVASSGRLTAMMAVPKSGQNIKASPSRQRR